MKPKELFFGLVLACLISVVVNTAVASQAIAPTGSVVAMVNGLPVTVYDLNDALQRILPMASYHGNISGDKLLELRKKALQEAIDKELLSQEAVRVGIKVSRAEIDGDLDVVRKRFPSDKDFKAAMKNSGITLKQYTEAIKKGILVRKLLNKEVYSKAVTDAEIRAYYDNNKSRFLEPERVRVFYILLKVDPAATNDERKKVLEKAKDIAKKAKAGEDFSALAWKYSEDAYRVKGGDLGFIHRGMLASEIENVVFSLKDGEVAGPIETLEGYSIVKVGRKEPQRQLSFSEIKDKLKKDLERQRTEKALMDIKQRLRNKAKIEIMDKALR